MDQPGSQSQYNDMNKGTWIAFEGLDGCGKSTQASILAQTLGATLTHEPGNSDIGAKIREVLLHHQGPIGYRTEVLLFAADRSEHVERVVRPVLSGGGTVVSDRSVWSSVVYQGDGRGLGGDDILAVNRWASHDTFPDIVVYLRAATGRATPRGDRIENAGATFYTAVEAGFERLAATEGWIVVENEGNIEEIATRIEAEVRKRLT